MKNNNNPFAMRGVLCYLKACSVDDLLSMTNDSKHNNLPVVDEKKSLRHGNLIEITNSKLVVNGEAKIGDKTYKNLEIDGLNVKYDNMDEVDSGFKIISEDYIKHGGKLYHAKSFVSNCLNNIVKLIVEYEKIK